MSQNPIISINTIDKQTFQNTFEWIEYPKDVYTVDPVAGDHPCCPEKVVAYDRWSLATVSSLRYLDISSADEMPMDISSAYKLSGRK